MQVSCSSWKVAVGLLATPLGAIKIRLTRLGRVADGSWVHPTWMRLPLPHGSERPDEIPFAIIQMCIAVALPATITEIRADRRGEPHRPWRPWRRAPFGDLRVPSAFDAHGLDARDTGGGE